MAITAASAAIGISKLFPTSSSPQNPTSKTPFLRSRTQNLSSSSSSHLSGGGDSQLLSKAISSCKKTAPDFRSPIFVSPKAVSDSRNSQTCLYPDACRSVLGIILGGGADTRLYPLTKKRAKPVVPLGANYRLIDMPVSNCLNSNISKIYVLTQFNSASINRLLSRAYGSNMSGYKCFLFETK